jgi:predicted DNA-binding transcriptional regulator AlpA
MTTALLVSAVDGAGLLGVSERTFHALRRRPDFPRARQLGPRCMRYSVEELRAWASALPAQGPQAVPRSLAQKRKPKGDNGQTAAPRAGFECGRLP